ncbi:MAG: hypothetical protein KAH57_01190, partial [Thermoplasmata archaeon]|nr:hypothetical protein [Thermoplasmata archaeon]
MTDDLSDNMMKLMGISVPVLVYNPTGHFDISLVSSAHEAGALGIMDAEHLGPDGIKEALTSLRSTGAPFGVRLNPMSDSLMTLMGEGLPEGLRTIISTPKEGIPEMVRQGVYDTAHSMNLKVLQEVCSAEEAVESSRLGADGIVIRGSETGGRAAPLKALDLFEMIKKDCGSTPILIKGGVTLTNAREMLDKGIFGLVMGEQVYTIGASPLSDTLKGAIRSCTEEDFFQVGSSVDRVFSGYCPDRKVREELLSMETSMADGSTDRKEAYKAIRSEMNNRGGAGFTDDRGTSPFLLMGTDGLMAREFEKA